MLNSRDQRPGQVPGYARMCSTVSRTSWTRLTVGSSTRRYPSSWRKSAWLSPRRPGSGNGPSQGRWCVWGRSSSYALCFSCILVFLYPSVSISSPCIPPISLCFSCILVFLLSQCVYFFSLYTSYILVFLLYTCVSPILVFLFPLLVYLLSLCVSPVYLCLSYLSVSISSHCVLRLVASPVSLSLSPACVFLVSSLSLSLLSLLYFSFLPHPFLVS